MEIASLNTGAADRSRRSCQVDTSSMSSGPDLSVINKQTSITNKKTNGCAVKRSKGALERFKVSFGTGTRVLKGEDILFIEPLPIFPESMMFMVCDGHSGADAANYVVGNFYDILCSKLVNLPSSMPDVESTLEVEAFSEELRRMLCETFVRIENAWTELGHMAGTTVTVVLIMDYLMTVANTGDSEGVLDTGCSILELTESHRIQTHERERQRLKSAGCRIAQLGFHLQGPAKPGEPGVGPLRIWPGGLCVSRSIGDVDAGPEIVPFPHVKQLLLPEPGCRIIISSDGLWDVLTLSKAVKLVRSKPTPAAAAASLIEAVLRDQRFMDDTSVIVIDVLTPLMASFPAVALQAGLDPLVQVQRSKQSRGLCSCFSAGADSEPDSRDMEGPGPGRLKFFADVDCLVAYPSHKDRLMRKSVALPDTSGRAKEPDYTVHNTRQFFSTGSGAKRDGSANPSADGHSREREHSRSRHDPLTPAASLEEELDADASVGREASGSGATAGPRAAQERRGVTFAAGTVESETVRIAGVGLARGSGGAGYVAPSPYEGSKDERVRNAKTYKTHSRNASFAQTMVSVAVTAAGPAVDGGASASVAPGLLTTNGSKSVLNATSTSEAPAAIEDAAAVPG